MRVAVTRDGHKAWKDVTRGWRFSEAFIAELSRVRAGVSTMVDIAL